MWKDVLKRYIPILRHRPTVLRLHTLVDAFLGIPAFLRIWLGRGVAAPYLQRAIHRVVFVAEAPLRREPKFAYALKRAGWEVVLLHRQPLKLTDLNDFSEIHRYTSPWHAAELAHHAKAQVVHAFANHFDTTTRCLVENKPSPVIVDFYDIFEGIADALPEMQRSHALDIALQKHCIARADGVCCPDLQLQYNRRATRLARGKPTILFPNYCWDRNPLPERQNTSEIHIVQIGWIYLETLGFADIGCFQVVREFVAAGCHFHLYFHPSHRLDENHFNDVFRDYIALGNETGRVHFHKTVPTDRLIEELTRFDYGLNMLNAGNFGMEWQNHNPRWLPLLASGRLFDYLDAGLGMLVDGILKFNRHLFRTSGALIDGTALLHSGRVLERLADRPRRETILKARGALSVERQIHRLIAFYDAVSRGAPRAKLPKRLDRDAA